MPLFKAPSRMPEAGVRINVPIPATCMRDTQQQQQHRPKKDFLLSFVTEKRTSWKQTQYIKQEEERGREQSTG